MEFGIASRMPVGGGDLSSVMIAPPTTVTGSSVGNQEGDVVLDRLATSNSPVSTDIPIEKEILIVPYVGDVSDPDINRHFGSLPLYFQCIGEGISLYREILSGQANLMYSAVKLPVAGTFVGEEHLNNEDVYYRFPRQLVTEHKGFEEFWLFGISGSSQELRKSAQEHFRAIKLLEAEDGVLIPRQPFSSHSRIRPRPIRITVKRHEDIVMSLSEIEELKETSASFTYKLVRESSKKRKIARSAVIHPPGRP
jgi:hypothetical protein